MRKCNKCKKLVEDTECVWRSEVNSFRNMCLSCEREKTRKYYKANKSKFAVRDSKLTEKRKARNKIKNAIARGLVERKPCEVCGEKDTHAHHDDYSKPMEVRFLCRKHHAEHHRKLETSIITRYKEELKVLESK